MINKLAELLRRIQASNTNGIVDLFMIAKMDEFTDKWTLLISTTWTTNEETRKSVFNLVWNYLSTELGETDRRLIARIGIADSSTYLVSQVVNYLKTQSIQSIDPNQPAKLDSFKANGNIVHEAYLFAWGEDNYQTSLI